MTDKLGTNESIAKVYQFLSNYGENWQKDADTNDDKTIIRTEMRSFLFKYENEWSWDGQQKYDASDIFNKFWNSANMNTKGSANARGTSNKIGLDKNELENMRKNVEITDVVRAFVDDVQLPPGLNGTKYEDQFIESVKASLLNKAMNHTFTAKLDDKEAFDAEVKEFLQSEIADSSRKTAADCYKYQAIADLVDNNKIDSKYMYPQNPNGYNPNKDEDLDKLIESYIGNIKNSDATLEEIQIAINTLVNDYLSSAALTSSTGSSAATFRDAKGNEIPANDPRVSSSEARLKFFGVKSGKMNDLQTAVLKVDMKESIEQALSADSKYGEKYNANKADFNDLIEEFITEKLRTASSDQFESLRTGAGATFISEKAARLDEIIAKIDELNGKRDTLINKVKVVFSDTSEYKDEKLAVVTKVFGAEAITEDGLSKAIYAMSVSQLEAAEAEFDKEIALINEKINGDEFFKDVQSSYTVFGGSPKTVATLPTDFGTHSTGTLKFSSTNPGLVDIDSDGNVIINKNKYAKGNFYDEITISVMDVKTGNVLAKKVINSIKITSMADDDKNTVVVNNKTWTIKDLVNNTNIEESCVQLTYQNGGFGDAKDEILPKLNNILKNLSTVLQTYYPEFKDKIANAEKTLKAYYTALIETSRLGDESRQSGTKSNTVTYTNYVTGETESKAVSYSYLSGDGDHIADSVLYIANAGGINRDSGLYVSNDDDCGPDDYTVYLDMSVVMNKFLSLMSL